VLESKLSDLPSLICSLAMAKPNKNLISFTENNSAAKDSFNNFQTVASTHPLLG
jgi:hypothetical protein